MIEYIVWAAFFGLAALAEVVYGLATGAPGLLLLAIFPAYASYHSLKRLRSLL